MSDFSFPPPEFPAVYALPPRMAAEHIYQDEGLPLPPFPAGFADAQLSELSRGVFSTELPGEPVDLYSAEDFLTAVLTGTVPTPSLTFGFGGHGVASQAVHYYVVTPHIIVLLQRRWGCFMDDENEVRTSVTGLTNAAASLVDYATAAAGKGLFPDNNNTRLVVIDSSFSPPRLAWIPAEGAGAITEPEIAWEPSDSYALLYARIKIKGLGKQVI